MDPIKLIVTAIALGAAASSKPAAVQAVIDAYAGLKQLIVERSKYQGAKIGVGLVESNPQSEDFQNTAKKLFAVVEAWQDRELLRRAQVVVLVVEKYAPETAAEINIKPEDIRSAANFRLEDIGPTANFRNDDMLASGESLEEAISVLGVSQEYAWLTQQFGRPGKDWQLVQQRLLLHEGGRYDEMIIRLADGAEKVYFFKLPY